MPRDGELAFVADWADLAQRFFEKVLVHTKGRWARSPFILTDWQREDIIRPLWGTARYDAQWGTWVRAYNEAWIELPRGNGKSEILAGTGLKLLAADDEYAAEIYAGAVDRDQAAVVFNVAKHMVELSPILSKLLTVVDSRKTIVDPRTNSFFRVISGDAAGNFGQGPHGILFDEVWVQRNRDLYDALRTGLGKRHQPLMMCALTAGNDVSSWVHAEHQEVLRILEDPKRHPNRFAYMRAAPRTLEEAQAHGLDKVPEIFSDTALKIANPAAGDFLSTATLRAEAKAAQTDPTKEQAYLQFRLNVWTQSATRYISILNWDKGGGLIVEEDLQSWPRQPFGGLDLSATSDLTSLTWLFPPELVDEPTEEEEAAMTKAELRELNAERHQSIPVIWRFWAPESKVKLLDSYTGGAFSIWVREGRVTLSEGEVIEYRDVHRQIEKDGRDFGIADVSVDPWNSTSTIAWGEKHNVVMAEIRQTYAGLSPATKETKRLINTSQFNHGANPVARWCIDGLEVKTDPNENVRPIKPDRQSARKRIDGALSLIFAVDGHLRRGGRGGSVYDERGIEAV